MGFAPCMAHVCINLMLLDPHIDPPPLGLNCSLPGAWLLGETGAPVVANLPSHGATQQVSQPRATISEAQHDSYSYGM